MKQAFSFIAQIFQSKAFGFLAVLFVLGTVLLIFGKLASTEWLSLMQWLGGGAVVRSAVGDFSTQKETIGEVKNEIKKAVSADTDTELASRVVDSSR
jgi:hypothetical protein